MTETLTTNLPPLQIGEVVWIEGKIPARVEGFSDDRSLVKVIYPAKERAVSGGFIRLWRELTVAVCFLERRVETP
jgi:hypothetical protein